MLHGRESNIKTIVEYSLVIILLTGGFMLYYWVLTRGSIMPGIDGPYYLIQVRSILETGLMIYDDPPLTFYLFALFSEFLGGVYNGVVIGVSALAALSAIPIYFFVRKVTGSRLSAIASIIFFLYSTYHVRLVADLMKNAVGVLFLAGFIYYLHDTAFNGYRKRSIILSIIFLTLTAFTHILDLGVAILFLVLYTIVVPLLQRRKQFLKSAGIMWSFLITLLFVGSMVTPFYFTDIGKGIAFAEDLLQPNPSSQTEPQLPPPEQQAPLPGKQAPQNYAPMWLTIPFLIAGAIMSGKELIDGNKQKATVLIVATTVGILLILPFIPQIWLWRFTLMEFIPLSIIFGVILSSVKKKTIIILSIFILTPVSIQAVQAVDSIPVSITEEGYRDLEAMKSMVPSDSVIVVSNKRGAYWVEYLLRVETITSLSPSLDTGYENTFIISDLRMRRPLPHQTQIIYTGEEMVLSKIIGGLPKPPR